MTTTTESLTSIADYLERQTDLAFLTYRRETQTGVGIIADWHSDRFVTRADVLYARWIAIGDAYYLVRDTLTRHEDQLRMWKEFLLALTAKSRHDTDQPELDQESTLIHPAGSGISQAESEFS